MTWSLFSWGSTSAPADENPNDSGVLKKKGINLNDQHAIKRTLDEAATEFIVTQGYPEDVALSNLKLGIGLGACACALVAQFYPKKFPENKDLLIGCIALYVCLHIVLQYIAMAWEKSHILFTHPSQGSVMDAGLAVSSSMGKCSDMYTLRIATRKPTSKVAKDPVEMTQSVTSWFTEEGILVTALFTEEVGKLLETYERSSSKKKK